MATRTRKTQTRRRKRQRKVPKGIVHIHAGLNNTIVTVTDLAGNALCWSSAGACGFKGARKGTPFAAQVASERAAKQCFDKGIRKVAVFVQGPGTGRRASIRAIYNAGLSITLFREVTGLAHNGCRPPKRRRL
uniref:Small ribosomal subunit protein uS11c n=1 Tax=Chloroparvula japonica TaxID=1411623 RepID=A0A4D6C442_9CHLO|nr:ribosomal protein S11 [Chloroparvula japonica]QBX98147.1 ribosomal protein S11 [Chloroparvula japonica]